MLLSVFACTKPMTSSNLSSNFDTEEPIVTVSPTGVPDPTKRPIVTPNPTVDGANEDGFDSAAIDESMPETVEPLSTRE